MQITQATSPEEMETARRLFEEYQAELGLSLCFQGFDQELAELPGKYAAPMGRLFLVLDNGEIAGCVALRALGEGTCEMKRLYLRAQFRGKGLARKLAEHLINDARTIGYQRMRLDTLPGKMEAAITLYRSLGFREIPPYYNNPVPGALFMELVL